MDNIKDLKLLINEEQAREKAVEQSYVLKKVTNPILGQIKKNLAQFKNENLSQKFDISDLLR